MVIGFVIGTAWGTIASLGFAFNGSGLNMVILILSIEGDSTRVFNESI